uniref:Nuclear pore complex protein Nup214 n=1 Tax=Cacopsylla melanoneura TaxID=428564 RepID=A0A8D8RVG3_9HEMI
MEPCPLGREVTDFQFKLFSSIRVFPAITYQSVFNNPSNTVTASNKHGLLIVGTPTGFQIVNFAQFVSPNAAAFVNESNDYPRREYNINAQPCHIALNCDETLLSVAHQNTDNSPLVRIYKMASLTNQSKNKVVKIPIGPPGTCITDFSWNPVVPELLAVCVSNGCLCLYSHDDTGKKLNILPPEKHVSCVSWSPKGKQLLAGDKFGNIVQYKPDLKEPQKVVPPPKDLFPGQCSIVNVIWLSVYQYGVIYMNNQSIETHFSIVNAPKNGPVQYVSYDEICFNSGTVRPHQFYFLHISAWNILIVSSSNSTEVSVLSLLDDKLSWEQWLPEDSTRLDLPIDRNKSETYPVGVTLATCSQLKIKWDDNKFLEPTPTLTIVSNDGLVLLFHVINRTPHAAQLCTPATPLPEHMFGTQAQPPGQAQGQPPAASSAPQVSVVSALPPSFNIAATSQGQSPVLEISTNQNAFSSAAPPLSLFNNKNISITPVTPKDAQQSLFTQNMPQTQPPKNDMFQSMAQSVFQTVLQGNVDKTAADIAPQPPPVAVAPTIVKTEMKKLELIVEEPPQVKPAVSKSKEKTGTIKREDLKIFKHLEESINDLLKEYKINIGSSELDRDLSKINDRIDGLHNFYQQLEESTTSLANDVSMMKHSLNEAFVYAQEAEDQLVKYERKKGHDRDPAERIMIMKKSVNPIVEKKLLSIENEIRKSSYYVRACIQQSRPIIQHLEIVKSGKNVLNFQSILQSINKEKSLIARCSLMLDEIDRDMMKMYTKQQIYKAPRASQKDEIVLERKYSTPDKPVDKFLAIKEKVKAQPKMSLDKLSSLKELHTTQVLEPIIHSEMSVSGLRSSDLLRIFKTPQKPLVQKIKDKSIPETIDRKEAGETFTVPKEAETFTATTPVISKTKATVPTALFGTETKPFVVPSPVLCQKPPEINKNTATFIIDTSNTKANATKLSFDDSIAAFGSAMTKNMFTSTPAVSNATKIPPFAAPTPSFGTTFTKVSDANSTQTATKPAFSFTVPASVPDNKTVTKTPVAGAQTSELFASGKPLFGVVATSTAPAPVLTFGTTTSSAFNVSIPSSVPATSTKTLFPVSTSTTTTSSFSFLPSSTSKLSFGSTTFTVSTTSSSAATSAAFAAPTFGTASTTASTIPTFGTASTTSTSSMFAGGSFPTFSTSQAFTKPTTPVTVAATPNLFGFGSVDSSKSNTSNKVVPETSQAPPVKFDFGTKTEPAPEFASSKVTSSENKTPEKSNDKKLEDIASSEHPTLSAADVSLTSLLASSPSVPSADQILITPVKPTPSDSKPSLTVTTTSAPTISFGSSTEFGGAPKLPTPSFSFLNAASESSAFSAISSAASSIATSISSSSESVSSTNSPQSAGNVTTAPSNNFGDTSKTSIASQESGNKTWILIAAPTTVTSSTEAVVPITPPKAIDLTATESSKSTSSVAVVPTTPTTTNAAPFATSPLVTPTSSTGFSTPAASVFGNPPAASTDAAQSSGDIGNLFGSSLSFGGNSNPTTQAATGSTFGVSGGNLFGGTTSTGGSTGGFGQSSGNIFAQKPPSTPSSGNLFGQSGGNLFGSQTPSGSVFAKSGSVFGDASKPAATAFGAASPSPFGQQTNTSQGGNTPFGNSSFGGGFGSTAAKTESSPFFGSNTATFGNTPTSSSSVFGTSSTSSASVFGQAATNSSPFGGGAGFGQSSVFGGTPTAGSGGFGAKSTFGQSGGSIFGGKSTFGQSGGSIFGSGGSSTGGSVFGGGGAGGGAGSFGSSGTFGQSTGFGSAAPTFGGSPFGGSSAGFGSSPSFGGSPSFGSTSPNKIFGSTDTSSTPQQNTSPGFGMAAATINSQLSFGNLAQQPAQTGFGSFGQPANAPASAFGSPQPAFGTAPTPSGGSFSSWR